MKSRVYEAVLIFDPELQEDHIGVQVNSFKEILGTIKGEMQREKNWGKRKLAFSIKKKDHGYYYYLQFTSNPDQIKELDRRLRLNDNIIRYYITVYNPIPMPDLTKPKLDKFSVGRRRVIPREIVDVSLENIHEFTLDKFTTDRGKIIPRRITRISSINQRRATRLIKRARYLAIIPYIVETYR